MWTSDEIEGAIQQVSEGGALDIRSRTVRSDDLTRVLRAAQVVDRIDFTGSVLVGDIHVTHVSVAGDVSFKGAQFRGDVRWYEGRFGGEVRFDAATFDHRADFSESLFEDTVGFAYDTEFQGFTSFSECCFRSRVFFNGVTFAGRTRFTACRFEGDTSFSTGDEGTLEGGFAQHVTFDRAVFHGPVTGFSTALLSAGASFDEADFDTSLHFSRSLRDVNVTFVRARFAGDLALRGARLVDQAMFGWTDLEALDLSEATITGDSLFNRAVIEGDLKLDGAQLPSLRSFGPVTVGGTVTLKDATFGSGVAATIDSARLSAVRTRFHGPTRLRLNRAEVALDQAEFAAACTIAGAPHFGVTEDDLVTETDSDAAILRRLGEAFREPALPQVCSLREADVAEVKLVDVDVRACRFAGVTNLDRLRTEGTVHLARSPRGMTDRQVLAEEHEWRADEPSWARVRAESIAWVSAALIPRRAQSLTSRPQRWNPEECDFPEWIHAEAGTRQEVVDPLRIAYLYRALRKGREDDKDEPGAADFYYGEMEMRRHAHAAADDTEGHATTAPAERVILTLYWLVSGYGLRASRALIALAVTVGAMSGLFYIWGFTDQPYWRALLYSAQSSVSLFRAPGEPTPTPIGEALQLVLRLLGPLFFGLALLALRARVKR
jgi:uncharacterized protein YjbI with pentapeptide repeats